MPKEKTVLYLVSHSAFKAPFCEKGVASCGSCQAWRLRQRQVSAAPLLASLAHHRSVGGRPVGHLLQGPRLHSARIVIAMPAVSRSVSAKLTLISDANRDLGASGVMLTQIEKNHLLPRLPLDLYVPSRQNSVGRDRLTQNA